MTIENEANTILLAESAMCAAPWALFCCCFTESINSTLSAVWVVLTPCTWNEQGRNGFFCLDVSG